MIILKNPIGRTSNIFFQHIHFDSFCKENNLRFLNPFIGRYHSVYPQLRTGAGYELASSVFRILRKLKGADIFKAVSFKNSFEESSHNIPLLVKKKIVLVEGWYFRSFETTLKYRTYYQKVFDPAFDKEKYESAYLARNSPIHPNIAVHIRRGDYQVYKNGQYFYRDDTYIKVLHSFLNCLSDKDPHIVIFSNERENNFREYISEFRSVSVSKESDYIDYFLMSQCDYIIGPPSTFSLWASYIGETPYYHIENKHKIISPEDFQICSG